MTLAEKDSKFREAVGVFRNIYPAEVIEAFIDYWTEPNKSGTRLRWEMERTWEVGRRLKTWARNNERWDKKSFEKPVVMNNKVGGSVEFKEQQKLAPEKKDLKQIEIEYQQFLQTDLGKRLKPNV